MENRCKLCWRTSKEDSEYCYYHHTALENLKDTYWIWRRALDIDWKIFLEEVSERSETGAWAREVAVSLLREKSS